MNQKGRPWVVVLAGGSGERLRTVTASPAGGSVPKQFCRLGGRDSMLGITLARARTLTTDDRIVVIVREEHRSWWEGELAGIPSKNVLVHSRNRGTAIALLDGLLHAWDGREEAPFVVLPSDHVVDDESLMTSSVREAVDEARHSSTHAVLVGAPAETPDSSLGWIMPGPADGGRCRDVMAFIEKPGFAQAAECVRLGALRNTLIFACAPGALLKLYTRPTGRVAWAIGGRIEIQDARDEEAVLAKVQMLRAAFPDLPDMDLGRHLLQPSAPWLRVLPLPECGWTDIGTIERLETWWKEHPAAWNRVRQRGVLPLVSETRPAGRSRPDPVRGPEELALAGSGNDPEFDGAA